MPNAAAPIASTLMFVELQHSRLLHNASVYNVELITASHLRGMHTHTRPFNSPSSGTTRVSRYQKGKTSLGFTEAKDSEWQ